MEKKKLTLPDLFIMKKEQRKIALLSVPDATSARLAESAGVDIVCLGDSLGMVSLGYPTTVPVTMEDMIRHGRAVRRGAPNTFLLASMPYQSYRTREVALDNATRFMQDVGADAIKIQGGKTVTHIINALANVSIPCFSHVGLVPHHFALLGGFKVQGRNADDALRIYQDALAIQEAGAVGVEIEAVPPQVAECITKKVDIITFGIGAGLGCDGQILLGLDMLGFFDAFKPKFVKRYANLAQLSIQAIATYVDEVKTAKFPGREHTYSMDASEEGKFLDLLQKEQG